MVRRIHGVPHPFGHRTFSELVVRLFSYLKPVESSHSVKVEGFVRSDIRMSGVPHPFGHGTWVGCGVQGVEGGG